MVSMSNQRSLVIDGALGFSIVAIVERRGEELFCAAENVQFELPLLQRIASLLPDRAQREALSDVVVGSGPGSYSGIRIAASAAVGIATALALPLREAPSDRALWSAVHRSFSIPLGTRESLEVHERDSAVISREAASPLLQHDDVRVRGACALVREAGPEVPHVTLRYPAPARGSEAR